jgi:hypothetical protein
VFPIERIRIHEFRPLVFKGTHFDLDIDVPQPSSVHHRVDIVGCILKDDMAVLLTLFESMSDRGSIVLTWVVASFHDALLGPRWSRLLKPTVRWAFLNDTWSPAVVLAQILANVLIRTIRDLGKRVSTGLRHRKGFTHQPSTQWFAGVSVPSRAVVVTGVGLTELDWEAAKGKTTHWEKSITRSGCKGAIVASSCALEAYLSTQTLLD